MPRQYEFELPVKLTAFVVSQTPFNLQSKGIWDRLPEALRWKLVDAAANFQAVEFSREELDTIDDDAWTELMAVLQFYV